MKSLSRAACVSAALALAFSSLSSLGQTARNPSTNSIPFEAEGTKRMVERIEKIKREVDPRTLQYMSAERAEALRKILPQVTDIRHRVPMRFTLGMQLLQAGQSEEALQEFEAGESTMASAGLAFDPDDAAVLRMRKAITLLRIGEQENCLDNHNAESCLFPLRPAAYHKLPRGSRGAIALLNEELDLYPLDLTARWLLNIAHMTLGEYPDKVPAKWLIPPKFFASDYDLPRFPNIAGALELDVDDLAGGCILDDFDEDGFLDVVISSWGFNGRIQIFRNNGNGTFTERTKESGLSRLPGGLNIQQTDYNNDGRLDIWILRGGWFEQAGRMPNSLLRNNGDGTFSDVTDEAGLLSFHPTQTSVWFDFDGDGWLDVFIGNETTNPQAPEPCELFRNNRDGTFTECAGQFGIQISRFVKGVASADYDRDGRPDLYLSCRDGANILLHNDGPAGTKGAGTPPWKFSDVTARAGVAKPDSSFPTWFFDYDNDGWEDLFVSGYTLHNAGELLADYLGESHRAEHPRLYRNHRDGTFSDVTEAAHLDRVCHTMGSNFGDLDNDGWLDFYLGTGDPDFGTIIPNLMFRNAEGKSFQDVTSAGGFGHLQKGHGVGFADLDNDGDQDVYAVIGGAYPGDNYRNVLFLNPGNGNRWLKLKLDGVTSNRAAIGARIKVNLVTPKGARQIYKTVNSGGSFGSSPLLQEIGLGDATALESVEIEWPASDRKQKITNVEINRAYRIREDEDKATPMNLKRVEFSTESKGAKHDHHHH